MNEFFAFPENSRNGFEKCFSVRVSGVVEHACFVTDFGNLDVVRRKIETDVLQC